MNQNEDDIVIKVENVKKYFKVYPDKGKTLKDKVLFRNRNKFEQQDVLKGISFEVKRGEAIGLIGKNGCGKSTTLKLLTRIIRPNEGIITIDGRVSSLIELGAGFHPDLTGRENIYINASIFGIKAKEVDERLDDIIRFSELEEFIDIPVRTYSSGMYMRLAFSVAINVDADILLIDEILAVGDMNFQEKCFRKLQEIKKNGTTIVIVSHAQSQIEKICDRCIWIENGIIRDIGNTKQICKAYQLEMENKRLERAKKEAEEELARLKKEQSFIGSETYKKKQEMEKKLKNLSCRDICAQCGPDAHREGSWKIKYTSIRMCNNNGEETVEFNYGEGIRLELEYESETDGLQANFSMGITRDDWTYCYGSTSKLVNAQYYETKRRGKVEFVIDRNVLASGKYYLDVRIQSENDEVYDNVFSIITFKVRTSDKYGIGIAGMENHWIVDGNSDKF